MSAPLDAAAVDAQDAAGLAPTRLVPEDPRARQLASSTPDVLPSSRLREPRGAVWRAGSGNFPGMHWVPIYCANCGADGGLVPEENRDFVCYLCNPCSEKYGQIAGTMLVPDEVFWEKVKQHQLDKYGRELRPGEVAEALKDGSSDLSKLARDRVRFGG